MVPARRTNPPAMPLPVCIWVGVVCMHVSLGVLSALCPLPSTSIAHQLEPGQLGSETDREAAATLLQLKASTTQPADRIVSSSNSKDAVNPQRAEVEGGLPWQKDNDPAGGEGAAAGARLSTQPRPFCSPQHKAAVPGGCLQGANTASVLANTIAAPRWTNWLPAACANSLHAGAAAIAGAAAAAAAAAPAGATAATSAAPTKKGKKGKAKAAQPAPASSSTSLPASRKQLGQVAGQEVLAAMPNFHQVIAALKAGKGRNMVFTPNAASCASGPINLQRPSYRNRAGFTETVNLLPQYMQTQLRGCCGRAAGGWLSRRLDALGQGPGQGDSCLHNAVRQQQSLEDAVRDRLQLATLASSTLQLLQEGRLE